MGQKKLAADETRVYEAFQKFDKDNDGEIEYSEFMAMWAKESGGYLWDDDIEEIKRDKEKTMKEVSNRRASMVTSIPVSLSTTDETPKDTETKGEEGSAPEEKKEPTPALPSAEELLASLQTQPGGDDGGAANEWASIALSDSEPDEPEQKEAPKKSKKKEKGKKKGKDKPKAKEKK